MRRTPPKITNPTTTTIPAADALAGIPQAPSSALAIALDWVPGRNSPQPITALHAKATAYQRWPNARSM